MKVSHYVFNAKALVLIAILWSCAEANAQNEVAIGSTTTKSNAILWLNGNGSQGLILPVVTNKTAVNNPDLGMIIYDNSDNKVWYRNASAWVEVGGSGSSVTPTLNLSLQGNQLQLRDGTTVLNSVNMAAGTQANGSFMVFQSGSWQYGQLTDATGTGTSFQITGLRGKSLATLPASAQALVYDPSANSGSGGWIFQSVSLPVLANGQILTGNGTTNSATTLSGDATLSGGALTIGNSAITSAKIADATITGADIANTTITADKLAQSTATSGQVLKWNGTNWVPQSDDVGAGATPTLTNGQIVVGNGTTNSAAAVNGDATLSGGTLTISNNAITTAKINANAVDATKLADNSVTSAKIVDATITAADIANATITAGKLAQSGANNNQVLQWNGTAWVPATVSGGGGVTQVNAGTGLTGGPITTTGTISIASSGVGSSQLADNAVVTNKINDNAVTSAKIADGNITGADISSSTITADKLAQSTATAGQVLKWNGLNWVPSSDDVGAGAAPTLTNGQILIGDGTSNSAAALSGDATLAGGALTIANNAITSVKIADGTISALDLAAGSVTGGTAGVIADGTITNADISSTAAIAGSKITPSFGAQNVSTTGTLTAGATNVTGLTIGSSVWPANAAGALTNNGTGTLSWTLPLTNPMTTAGDIIYGGSGGAATRLAAGTGFLKGGASPFYSSVTLNSSDVTGVLPVANGGTGLSTFGGGLLYASGPTNIGDIGNGTDGQILKMAGTTPTWSDVALAASPANLLVRGNTAGTAQEASSIFNNGTYTGINRTTAITGADKFSIGTNAASGAYGGMYLDTQAGGWPFYGYANGGAAVAWTYLNTTNNTWNVNYSGDRLSVTNTGNVGIGTTTPNAPLQFDSQAAARKIVLFEQVNNDHEFMGFGVGGFGTLNYQVPINSNDHVFQVASSATSSTELMRIKGTGNVGIGTANPAGKLHIENTDWDITPVVLNSSASSAGSTLRFLNPAIGNTTFDIIGSTGTGAATGVGSFGIWDNTNSAYRFVIGPTGNIGISTSNPAYKVHSIQNAGALNNTAAFYGSNTLTANAGYYGAIAYQLGTTRYGVYAHSDALANTIPLGVNRGADGALVSFQSGGLAQGSITVSAGTVSYNAFTGSHFAKTNESIERGMIVSLTGNNSHLNNDSQSELIYGVGVSTKANDPRILGAYLGVVNPIDPVNDTNPHQIMAVGNGEMWVIENGKNLEPGDYLISSHVPGHAMVDKGDYEIAYIIARVAEKVDWSTVETSNGKVKHQKVSVFFESFTVNHKANFLEQKLKAVQEDVEMLKQIVLGTQAKKN